MKEHEMTELKIVLEILNLMTKNEEVDDFITALNQTSPEVKEWMIKVLPHKEESE